MRMIAVQPVAGAAVGAAQAAGCIAAAVGDEHDGQLLERCAGAGVAVSCAIRADASSRKRRKAPGS